MSNLVKESVFLQVIKFENFELSRIHLTAAQIFYKSSIAGERVDGYTGRMSADIPSFLRPPENRHRTPASAEVPAFLRAPTPKEMKAVRAQYNATQYEMLFPRLMEMVCSGWQLTKAIEDLPIEIDVGMFTRWMYKDPTRKKIYEEMQEIRAELWTGKMLDHATGATEETNEVARDTLAVNTYKWLIAAHNRRRYGESKQIEINQSISIRDALQQGQSRISQVIDVDAEVLDEPRQLKLTSGDDPYEDDEE